uniref:Uncharacterized protein n=1 Tax=Sphaerodactylus townsendi TaxID=933632 RepID=A0ACB8ER13_9SAUR
MEKSVAEIMHQLGADENGKISFQDFTRCRMQLVREIRKEEVELSVKSDEFCKKKALRDRIASWPTSSDNSLDLVQIKMSSYSFTSFTLNHQHFIHVQTDLQSSSSLFTASKHQPRTSASCENEK